MTKSLVRKRDLRTGRSYWFSRRAPRVASSPLSGDIKTDILIVGAGVSGAFLADALSRKAGVVVVDRRGVMKGSTPASTALVEFEIDTPLLELGKQIGKDDAARAWRRSRLALESLSARTRALGIDCDMVRRDNLYLAGNVLDPDGLDAELEARRAAGLEGQLVSRKQLKESYGVGRAAALRSFDDLALDPRRLTSGYLRSAIAQGAKIHTPVEVVDVESASGSHVALTRDGPAIQCEHLIFATGYEFPKFAQSRRHRIASTYVIVTRPQRNRLWQDECFFWEASEPYLYIRTTPDGRVMCGGEDEDIASAEERDALLPKKTIALQRKLGRLMPWLDTQAEFAWAGAFGQTRTGLPIIGEVPGRPQCWAVLGYGGNGITFSRVAADVVYSSLFGSGDPDADLFAFA